jgi:hypothetical protein
VPHIVYKVLNALGPKLYFFRLPFENIATNDVMKEMGSDFNTKFDAIQSALFNYLKWFEICPDLVFDDRDGEAEEEEDNNNNKCCTAEKDLRFKAAEGQEKNNNNDNDNDNNDPDSLRLLKMKWDRDKDDYEAKKCIAQLAILLSHLRCDVKTWRGGGHRLCSFFT